MARSLKTIYEEARSVRNQYLELTEFQNSSKMSVLDAITWVTSACIWSFENILDVFQVDVTNDLKNRVNGTPAYYVNALLKFQYGDELMMNDDGTQFHYEVTDATKRVITKAVYSETETPGFHDRQLVLKVAGGLPGEHYRIPEEQLTAARSYIQQIAFAGTHITIVSRSGDILVPKVTVCYDGAIPPEEMHDILKVALQGFIRNAEFDGTIYVNKILDTLLHCEHVSDVYFDNEATDLQGVFIASYDDDDVLIGTEESGPTLTRAGRKLQLNSGYLKESTGFGQEKDIPKWKESIILKVER